MKWMAKIWSWKKIDGKKVAMRRRGKRAEYLEGDLEI